MLRSPRVWRSLTLVLAGGVALPACASQASLADPGPAIPATVPEASAFTKTSTLADVEAFLAALEELPHADRLRTAPVGRSEEGRDLLLVTASLHPDADDAARLASGRLRILVNANIHGGEVEGKESVQMILREIAHGRHEELLHHADLFFVPIYNVDGNERIDVGNRVSQNGPDGGVGQRANANRLDLNRDFVKVESAECRALMSVVRRLDPHFFLDLHTTNGSHHGYQLTYAPSLATNVDPALDGFARDTYLPAVREAMWETHGYRVFDYGNFSRGEPRAWRTYDHRPRFGTNAYGLRNRFGVLSEAYSYVDFETRVRATRAFVLECLAAAVAERERIVELCAAADEAVIAGENLRFGFDSELAPGFEGEVRVGEVIRVELPDERGTRVLAGPASVPETMLVQDRFVSRSSVAWPQGWAVLAPTAEVLEALAIHGLEGHGTTAPVRARVERFVPSAVHKARRPFQGHLEIRLEGDWEVTELELPAGTWIVPARQRLGRLAAQLLEARSEDSLSTWNALEAQTRATDADGPGSFPVVRLLEAPPVR